MAVTRKIDEFHVISAYCSPWNGGTLNVSLTDPDSLEGGSVDLTLAEAKKFAKELKAVIKELEGK